MKRTHLALALAFVVGAVMAIATAEGAFNAPKAEEGVIVGEVVDIAGYGMFGRLGKENQEAGQYHASLGFPVGIMEEETGDLWIAVYRLPVPAAGLQTANAILAPYMGTTVVAQGAKFRVKGLNLIRLAVVSEY